MAAPKTGSRLIAVDGTTFRWRVRLRPSYCQANGWSPLTYSVEITGANGEILVVAGSGVRPDSWADAPVADAVVPSAVERAVNLALAAGWVPSKPGKPFFIDIS